MADQMDVKLFEIRDEGTLIVALCVNMNPTTVFQRAALRRLGFPCDGRPNIMLTYAGGRERADNDPYSWKNRTLSVAHNFITDSWADLKDGALIDVQFLLGETAVSKTTEIPMERAQ